MEVAWAISISISRKHAGAWGFPVGQETGSGARSPELNNKVCPFSGFEKNWRIGSRQVELEYERKHDVETGPEKGHSGRFNGIPGGVYSRPVEIFYSTWNSAGSPASRDRRMASPLARRSTRAWGG